MLSYAQLVCTVLAEVWVLERVDESDVGHQGFGLSSSCVRVVGSGFPAVVAVPNVKMCVEVCALRAQRERGGKRKLACKPRACRAQRVCSPCSSLSSRLSTTVVDQKNSSESSK